MKFNLKSIAAIATLAAVSLTAQAQNIAIGDLFVGFKSTTDANNLLIKLGTADSLKTLAGAAGGTYVIGNFSSQLTSTFGADFGTVTGTGATNWAVSGVATTELQDQPWITGKWAAAAGVLGVKNSTAAASKSGSALNSASAEIQDVYAGFNTAQGTAIGGGAYNIAAGASGSFASNTTGTLFGQWATSAAMNQASTLNASVGASVMDLYKMLPSTAGVFEGTFALYQNGDLTFSVAAIPEPSTYAMILGVATLGFAAIRRRKQANLLA